MNDTSHRAIATRCAHAGSANRDGIPNAPFQQPIVQSTLFRLGSSAEAEAIFSGAQPGYAYSRFGNPSVDALAEAIADLEGGSGCLVTSSGNAAVLCAVTAAMADRSGPLVTHPGIYGGSVELLEILSSVYRLAVSVVDPEDGAAWAEAVAGAGAVLIESPSNPLLRLIDLSETVRLARAGGAAVIVDNTVATPMNQRPLALGVDWVVHSTSKYLNGHSDLIAGAVVKRDPLTRRDRAIHKNLGGTVNAMESWLALRGLRTFALRMAQHNRNGEAVRRWLEDRPEVRVVHFPGGADDRQREIFQRQMNAAGALLSFELKGGADAARRFLDRLQLIVHAVSLGGMESLATRPAASSHRGMSAEARQAAGVADSLIRLSVGVEAPEDLFADLDQALRGAISG